MSQKGSCVDLDLPGSDESAGSPVNREVNAEGVAAICVQEPKD